MVAHALSVATGRAVAILLGDAAVLNAVTIFAERARTRLLLDNEVLVSAMMLTQSLLLQEPQTPWRRTYTAALVLGAKLHYDGFFLSDFFNHVADVFTLRELGQLEMESLALLDWNLARFAEPTADFRAALVNVALHEFLPLAEPNVAGLNRRLLVLLVDADEVHCAHHRELLTRSLPNALVHSVASADAALAYVRARHAEGEQVDLVLTDLCIDAEAGTGGVATLEQMLAAPNGFDLADQLAADAVRAHPRIDFLHTPFVAMVTAHAHAIEGALEGALERSPSGGVRGCEALIPKPLSPSQVRALVECCAGASS